MAERDYDPQNCQKLPTEVFDYFKGINITSIQAKH